MFRPDTVHATPVVLGSGPVCHFSHERWKRAPDTSGEWEGKRRSGIRFTVRRIGEGTINAKWAALRRSGRTFWWQHIYSSWWDALHRRYVDILLTVKRSWQHFTSLTSSPAESGMLTCRAGSESGTPSENLGILPSLASRQTFSPRCA